MTGEPLCGPGDTILLANGENRKVDSVEIEFLDDPVTVYNFEVADWHTYFVGNTGVLVHNANIQACSDAAASAGGNGKAAGGAGEGGNKTTSDIYSFGNKSSPRGARPFRDFGVESFDSIVGPEYGPLPQGASNVLDVKNAPLNGHYHMLPAGTQMPDGLDIIADGTDVVQNSPHGVGHYTIFPTREMTVNEFNELYKSLPWQYRGSKP